MEQKLHAEILEDNNLFNKAFLYAPIGKVLVSQTGRFIKVNPSFCKFIGYSEEDLLLRDYQSIAFPDDLESLMMHTEKLFNGELPSFEMEKRYIHKNGNTLWGLLSCSLVSDEKGSFAIGQIVDITKRKKAEADLAFATDYLESFVQNTSDGIVIFDLEGHILRVNPAFETMFGWKEEEIKGERLPITPDSTQEDAEYLLREAQVGNIVNGYETIKQCKNGSKLHVSITMSSIRNKEKEIIALVGLVRNIQDRKMMEMKLRESEKRFRSITENAFDMISIHDGDGKYVYVSPSFIALTGYEEHEFIGNAEGYKFIHPEDIQLVKENYVRVLQFNSREPINFRFQKRDGSYIWLQATCQPIPDMETGEVREIVFVSRDITEHKKLMNQLSKSQRLFEIISNHSQDIISISDAGGVTKYISPTVKNILGYDPEEVLDKPTTDFWHPDDVFAVSQSDLLQHSDDGTFECRVRHKDGHYLYFETSFKFVRDAKGNLEQVVGIGRDMTERKRAEHYMVLSEKLSVVSQLAAGIAHEIRNPLTAIKGFIRLIKDKLVEETYYFDIIVEEINRVELILQELLVLSKPKGAHWEKKGIHEILSQVVTLLRSQAILHNIELLSNILMKTILKYGVMRTALNKYSLI